MLVHDARTARNMLTAVTFAATLSVMHAPGVTAGENVSGGAASQRTSRAMKSEQSAPHGDRTAEAGKGFLGRFFSGKGNLFFGDEERHQTASINFDREPSD